MNRNMHDDMLLAPSTCSANMVVQDAADHFHAGSGVATVAPSETPTLRGLNIQWPFSQLIMHGAKTTEARRYQLGHLNIAQAGENLWLVETPGPNVSATKNAVIGDVQVAPRPTKAQIIGTICFSHSTPYKSRAAFRKDVRSHCIKEGGALC